MVHVKWEIRGFELMLKANLILVKCEEVGYINGYEFGIRPRNLEI